MAVSAGRHQLGPDHGRIILRTFREGLAGAAGHDLTIEVTRWSGELDVNEDLSPASLSARVDIGALAVREGTGGVKPLTDRDRREIAATARKVLASDRYPEATFTATSFEPGASGGGVISGSLTLRDETRPLRIQVSETGRGRYRGMARVVQTDYRIKPYTGFLGALRVRDAVDVEVDVDLPEPEDGQAGTQAGQAQRDGGRAQREGAEAG